MLYVTTQKLNIRRSPRITPVNRVGMLDVGMQREILEILPANQNGEVWGRITEPDNKGVALWVCISNMNTKFMLPVESESPQIAGRWAQEVDAFLRGLGYKGVKP